MRTPPIDHDDGLWQPASRKMHLVFAMLTILSFSLWIAGFSYLWRSLHHSHPKHSGPTSGSLIIDHDPGEPSHPTLSGATRDSVSHSPANPSTP